MIALSNITNPSQLVIRRARLMWATKCRSANPSLVVYLICPHGRDFNHQQKEKRIVTLDLNNKTAKCVKRFSGESCEANADFVPGDPETPKSPRLCCHVLRAMMAWQTAEKRRNKITRRLAA